MVLRPAFGDRAFKPESYPQYTPAIAANFKKKVRSPTPALLFRLSSGAASYSRYTLAIALNF